MRGYILKVTEAVKNIPFHIYTTYLRTLVKSATFDYQLKTESCNDNV